MNKSSIVVLWLGVFVCLGLFFQNCSRQQKQAAVPAHQYRLESEDSPVDLQVPVSAVPSAASK